MTAKKNPGGAAVVREAKLLFYLTPELPQLGKFGVGVSLDPAIRHGKFHHALLAGNKITDGCFNCGKVGSGIGHALILEKENWEVKKKMRFKSRDETV